MSQHLSDDAFDLSGGRAPALYSMDARNGLNFMNLGQWIGLGGPINWLTRSSCINFFMWGSYEEPDQFVFLTIDSFKMDVFFFLYFA